MKKSISIIIVFTLFICKAFGQTTIELQNFVEQGIKLYDNGDYKIKSVKGKTFSSYHILAYYYVSWSLAIPELVSQFNLPYKEEDKMALTMNKPNK